MDIDLIAATKDARRGQEICRLLAQAASGQAWSCECCDLAMLVARAALRRPDVAIADISDAEEAAPLLRQLRRVSPATRVLLLAGIATQDLAVAAIRGGASGILGGEADARALGQAIGTVAGGGAWFDHELLYRTLHRVLRHAPAPVAVRADGDMLLTPREKEILTLIGDGLSNKEIGRRLAISDTTVKTHLHRIYVKLNRSGRYKAFRAQPKGPLPSGWGTLV